MLTNGREVRNNRTMKQLVIIEPMTEADLEAVAAIEQASFQDPWPLQSFCNELQNNRLAIYFVARSEDLVIAYLGAWIIIDEIHITTMAVAEPYRRRGIGDRLINVLSEKAQLSGAHCLTLEVRPSNTAARCFYEKLGFVILGRRKRYYRNEDALIMTKEIEMQTRY